MSDPAANVELEAATPRRLLGIDLFTSYLLSFVRIAAAAAIIGLLFRRTTPAYVATFILARSMLTMLNYVLGGLNPATQNALARPAAAIAVASPEQLSSDRHADSGSPISYEPRPSQAEFAPPTAVGLGERGLLRNTFIATLLALIPCGIACVIYSENFFQFHEPAMTPRREVNDFVSWLAIGLLLRLASEPAGALLQAKRRLALDNTIQLTAELAWVAWVLTAEPHRSAALLRHIGAAYLVTGLGVFTARWMIARSLTRSSAYESEGVRPRVIVSFLLATAGISLGQFADFLYGPANLLIINRALSPTLVAVYGPALQVDAALLLCVAALSTVVLPRAAEARRDGDAPRLRRIYIRATLASLALLLLSGGLVTLLREPILRLWLGSVSADTLTILPLVLIHTVIGGTAGIGRAVLLGMGRFKAYTLSALVGGIANVALALLFVVGFGWGLRGIVFATIIAVTLRCALWMPWYILRTLRSSDTPARLTR